MEKMTGSMEVLNSLQTTANIAGLNQASKELSKNKELLTVILKGVAREFEPYTYQEIMDSIEADSITDSEELWKEVDRMCGLVESILLEGESRGIGIGETNRVACNAKVFKAVQAGKTDNKVIAALCGCTVDNVVQIR